MVPYKDYKYNDGGLVVRGVPLANLFWAHYCAHYYIYCSWSSSRLDWKVIALADIGYGLYAHISRAGDVYNHQAGN